MDQSRKGGDAAEVVIVGAGLAGHAAALALAARGIASRLIGPPPAAVGDGRTTALMQGSLAVLNDIGLLPQVRSHAAPLETMAIVDATRRLVRARPIAFAAVEIGLDAFGWNVPNADLLRVMRAAVDASPAVERIEAVVVRIECGPQRVCIAIDSGQHVDAALAVAADGHASPTRLAAGIAAKTWRYPQTALAFNVRHSRPHANVSTEFHDEGGPCTLVPLPGERSSVVLMVRREDGERLAALAPKMLARDVERRVHSRLGRMEIDGDLSVWPMRGLSADRMAARRVALIGEAGHVFPPIGAQGFNLTMRDVASLATVVSGAADPGAHDVVARYGESRRGDVASRTAMVDAMNRSLLSDFLPVQVARSAGFLALDRIPALRRLAMRQGLAPADQPFYPA